MNPLEQIIIEKIRREGLLTFEAFMEMALYHPEFGYYSSPESSIGREGDFFTSPHLHPIFGAMIGRQLSEMWQCMDRPTEFHIVEMGAGHGYLARDILDYLMKSDGSSDFVKAIQYIIVEPYRHFEDRQRALLGSFGQPPSAGKTVKWVPSLQDLNGVTGCILSNELLDAFPVHMIRMNDAVHEVYVDFDGEQFIEKIQGISSPDITSYLNMFSGGLPPGYTTEINLKIKTWLEDVAAVVKEGFVLTVDYGYTAKEYYSDDRTAGTLLCYSKHRLYDSPFRDIGKQDITAHVNFSSLKVWGEETGFKTVGYCPQGTFLTAAGIDEVIAECYAGSDDYLSELAKIKRLIFPQGLGESHNVMVQYKGTGSPVLRGFSMRNLLDAL